MNKSQRKLGDYTIKNHSVRVCTYISIQHIYIYYTFKICTTYRCTFPLKFFYKNNFSLKLAFIKNTKIGSFAQIIFQHDGPQGKFSVFEPNSCYSCIYIYIQVIKYYDDVYCTRQIPLKLFLFERNLTYKHDLMFQKLIKWFKLFGGHIADSNSFSIMTNFVIEWPQGPLIPTIYIYIYIYVNYYEYYSVVQKLSLAV